MQATNAAGDSGWSDSAKATPRTVPSKPSPTLTAADQKITASWSAPSDGGLDITGYKVRHRATGTNEWTTSSSQTGTSKEIGSLTNGTEYEVQVQATNAAGDSGWSDSAKATPRTVPSKPSPTLTAADQKITASWSAPSDGGLDITGYKVRHRATGTNEWTTSSSQTGTSKEIGSLTNGTEYEVQVQAANAAGDSGWSDSAKATPYTTPSKPAAPTLTAADQKITASWSAPSNGGSDITGYKVRHRATGTSDWTTSSSQTGTSKEIGSLTNGTEYEVQVQATNAAGDSGWSDSARAKPGKPPSAPSWGTTTAQDKQVSLAWTAPTELGGGSISSYRIQWKSGSQQYSLTERTMTTALLSETVSSLTNLTTHYFRVRAQTEFGGGAWSAEIALVPHAASSQPQAPSLTCTPKRTGANKSYAQFDWTDNYTGTSPITGYKAEVKHRDPGSADWTTNNLNYGSTTKSFTRYAHGYYQVKVIAVNSVGDSAWSATVSCQVEEGSG